MFSINCAVRGSGEIDYYPSLHYYLEVKNFEFLSGALARQIFSVRIQHYLLVSM